MGIVDRTTKIKAAWARLTNKSYRDAYVSGMIGNSLASQVFSIRRDRGWTQADLADRAGMRQARISALEGTCEDVSLNTLKRLASAFDVALSVKFVPFSELIRHVTEINVDEKVPSFESDTPAGKVSAPILYTSPPNYYLLNETSPRLPDYLKISTVPTSAQVPRG